MMRQQHVVEWMSTPPITIAPSMNLEAARRLMQQQHVRRLPVVADGQLIGIITWSDLLAAQPSAASTLSVHEVRALLDKVTIAACMTRDPRTVTSGASVLEAAQLLREHKIGGLPVVDDERVVGMITKSDLFRMQAQARAAGRIGRARMRTNAGAE